MTAARGCGNAQSGAAMRCGDAMRRCDAAMRWAMRWGDAMRRLEGGITFEIEVTDARKFPE
jgi:hypothetical protein